MTSLVSGIPLLLSHNYIAYRGAVEAAVRPLLRVVPCHHLPLCSLYLARFTVFFVCFFKRVLNVSDKHHLTPLWRFCDFVAVYKCLDLFTYLLINLLFSSM